MTRAGASSIPILTSGLDDEPSFGSFAKVREALASFSNLSESASEGSTDVSTPIESSTESPDASTNTSSSPDSTPPPGESPAPDPHPQSAAATRLAVTHPGASDERDPKVVGVVQSRPESSRDALFAFAPADRSIFAPPTSRSIARSSHRASKLDPSPKDLAPATSPVTEAFRTSRVLVFARFSSPATSAKVEVSASSSTILSETDPTAIVASDCGAVEPSAGCAPAAASARAPTSNTASSLAQSSSLMSSSPDDSAGSELDDSSAAASASRLLFPEKPKTRKNPPATPRPTPSSSSTSRINPRRLACWCAIARKSTQTFTGYLASTASIAGTDPTSIGGGQRAAAFVRAFFLLFAGFGCGAMAFWTYDSTYSRRERIARTTSSTRNDLPRRSPSSRIRNVTAAMANLHHARALSPPLDGLSETMDDGPRVGRRCACGARLASRSRRSAATYTARRCEDVSLAATESIRRWIRCAGTFARVPASSEPAGSRFPLRS